MWFHVSYVLLRNILTFHMQGIMPSRPFYDFSGRWPENEAKLHCKPACHTKIVSRYCYMIQMKTPEVSCANNVYQALLHFSHTPEMRLTQPTNLYPQLPKTCLIFFIHVGKRILGSNSRTMSSGLLVFNLPKMWGVRTIFWFFCVMWHQSSDST